MNPLIDQIAVGVIIAGALAFFIVRYISRRSSKKGCVGECGCESSKKAVILSGVSRSETESKDL